MMSRYEATQAALAHFDNVDQPALAAMRTGNRAHLNVFEFNEARRRAADRVREAFHQDTSQVNTWELVELLSVDAIRRMIGGTFLGKLLARLP